jgi:tRNA (uracil-5-)-methyltransferase
MIFFSFFSNKHIDITNITYIVGKIEAVIQNVFQHHVAKGDEVVAILDPPRSGVHSSVIQSIRACPGLKRVIFISCDAEAASGNFIE